MLLRAQILAIELDPTLDLLVHLPRQADAARRGDPFQSSRHIDAVAIDADLVTHDVALVDTDPKLHSAARIDRRVALQHRLLNGHRTIDRVQHTGKFGKDAIAGGINDSAAEACDHGQNDALVALEVADGRFLVRPHQAAVASDVGSQNGGELTLNPRGRFGHFCSNARVKRFHHNRRARFDQRSQVASSFSLTE